MLPSVSGWFGQYAQPKFEDWMTRFPEMEAREITAAMLAQSPIGFATPEYDTLGSVCAVPTGPSAEFPEPIASPAMHDLYDFVYGAVVLGLDHFRATNEPVLPVPEA
jgi:hypothetical protein